MMRIAITGADGFVGRHLTAQAHQAGHDVIAVTRSVVPEADPLRAQVDRFINVDLAHARPELPRVDAIVHLAGLAAVGPSFDAPLEYVRDNSAMMINIAEDVLAHPAAERPRLLVVSTGAVYAQSASALSESSPLSASSPYVVSKRSVETLADYYVARGLDAVVARPFNHVGPGQRAGYIVPDLVRKVSILEDGDTLAVGNLQSRRDYTDVRDVANAYLALASAPRTSHRVYNVASGHSTSGFEILSMICAALGREVPATTTDESSLRPTDVSEIVGDADRVRAEFGWEPLTPLVQSVSEYVTGIAG